MIDTQNLAALFSAMGDIPTRLAALEQSVTDSTAKPRTTQERREGTP